MFAFICMDAQFMGELKRLNKHPSQINDIARAMIRRARPIEKRNYEELPEIYHTKDYAIIYDAVVGLKYGLYVSPCSLIVKYFSQFSENIFLRKVRPEFWTGSAKNIMSLLVLEAENGSKLDILVQMNDLSGADAFKVDKIALDLYRGITTRAEYPNMNRVLNRVSRA